MQNDLIGEYMFSYLDDHSGSFMALLTLVYTVTTICLARQNRKSIEQARKHFEALYDGKVFPSLTKLEGEMLCLQFENPTQTPVEGFKATINQEWLNQYDNVVAMGSEKTRENLESINKAEYFTLMPKQEMSYFICTVPGEAYTDLSRIPLIVTIVNPDGMRKEYMFDLMSMGRQLAMTDNYTRFEKRKLIELRDIASKIGK